MIKRINAGLAEFESNSKYQYFLLAAVTLLAGVLRFYKLGEWSFWGDEIATVRAAQDLFTQHIFNRGIANRPISLMLIRAALAFLGTSEWSARLVPGLIGVISVPVLYFPVKKLFGPAVALMAGLLLAVSPWHLYWSQNARFYSLLLLFYTLALLTFFLGIEEDRPWYLLLSLFFLGLAAWERVLALFFVPVVMGYLALLSILPFEKPPGLRPRNLCLFFLPGLILALFFAWPYVRQSAQWLSVFERVNNNPFWILSGVVYYVRIPIICMGAMGALYLLMKKQRVSLLLGLGAMIPLFTVMLISLFHYAANRYAFISLTSWIILASLATLELLSQTQKSAKILAVGVLIYLLGDPLGEDVLYYKYQNGNRDNGRVAFELVRQQKVASDLVVTANPWLGNYYLQEKTIAMEGLDLSRIEENGGRIWFVEDMNVEERFPEVHYWIAKNAQLIANMDVHVHARNFKMRVYLYDPAKLHSNAGSRSSQSSLR